MSKELIELDQIMCGIKPMNFSAFGQGNQSRKEFPYTWDDLAFNLNSAPYNSDTAIIVTSYWGQLCWLKATLTSYRKTGKFVILSYDNNCFIWDNIEAPEYDLIRYPRPIHHQLAHATVFKHKTYDADKRTGWLWDVKYAHALVNEFKNFKYVYITNGDCFLDRPEGMSELPAILGDADFMSGQSEEGKTIHTANMFMKVEAFNKIVDYMSERTRHAVMAGVSPEALLRDAVDLLGLKERFVDQPIIPMDDPRENARGQIDYYCTRNTDSTWKRVLGFRNLYAEFEFTENYGKEPLPKGFLDPFNNYFYCREDWRITVCKYYETGDRRYLGMFWDRGKDTDTERRFYPLEAYGPEPILDSNINPVALPGFAECR